MKIEYINHSGYVVETDAAIYIFDFVEGTLPSHYLRTSKPVVFLVSHHHEDHYSSSVFTYRKTVILAYDIQITPYKDCFVVSPGDVLNLGFAKIYAFGSTDEGVSFVVVDNDTKILHGGDLNDWHWRDSSSVKDANEATKWFKSVMETLIPFAPIDVMMFAVDPRLGTGFYDGARYAVETLKPKYFFAMHYNDNYKRMTPFIDWIQDQKDVKFEVPKHDNKLYEIEV